MMQAAQTLWFILLLGSQVVWSRDLPPEADVVHSDGADPNETSCKAFGHLKIVVTKGKCSGRVESDCKAISQAKNRIAKAFDDWWGEAGPGQCATGQANATAVAHAQAIAKVWATGLSSVQCEDQGFAYVRALTATLAKATTSAQDNACSYGGDKSPIEVFEESYAEAIRIGIAEAYARAVARACDDSEDGRVKAASKCQGNASIDGLGRERDSGSENAETKVEELQGCQGDVKLRCCDRPVPQRMCTPCQGCARLRRITERDPQKNIKRSWELEDGQVCFCHD
ncbi:hypothetical protein BSKO_10173 [Bryopsis sp. KO-2023]|nr:hypothetical protein BSKO_10173 [Bryopsis sp. KO-2023]